MSPLIVISYTENSSYWHHQNISRVSLTNQIHPDKICGCREGQGKFGVFSVVHLQESNIEESTKPSLSVPSDTLSIVSTISQWCYV